jgi:hypothetical protein
MNTHPLNQRLDTIDDTVTDHNALLTSALAEHTAHEALISSLQHQFERRINVLTANLQSYTSIQRDMLDALRFHRTQRIEVTAYPVPPAITAVPLTSPDPSRALDNGRYPFYSVRKGRRTGIVDSTHSKKPSSITSICLQHHYSLPASSWPPVQASSPSTHG